MKVLHKFKSGFGIGFVKFKDIFGYAKVDFMNVGIKWVHETELKADGINGKQNITS